MCGRFTLRTPAKLLASWFQDVDFPVITPRYNIAPTQQILALRQSQTRQLEAAWLRWGLVPSWATDLKIGNQLINARSETAASKPAFRRAFKSRRCIILADGFYEWKQTSSGKQPFLIQSTDTQRPLFCFAGLWERWHRPRTDESAQDSARKNPSSKNQSTKKSATQKPGTQSSGRQLSLFEPTNEQIDEDVALKLESQIVESCTILTTNANEMMAALHDRMPVILDSTAQAMWLDQEIEDLGRLNSLLQPCPNKQLRIHPVSKLVNKPAFDNPTCSEPIPEAELQ